MPKIIKDNEVVYILSNGEFAAQVSYYIPKSKKTDLTVIFAQFTQDGILTDVTVKGEEDLAGMGQITTDKLQVTDYENKYLRVFVWDNFSTLRPTCASYAMPEGSGSNDDLSQIVAHKFTGAPVTVVPEELKTVNTRGGTIIAPTGGELDFSKPEVPVSGSARADFVMTDEDSGTGYYKISPSTENDGIMQGKRMYPVKTNRNYLCSALVWLDFDRMRQEQQDGICETTLYVRFRDNSTNPEMTIKRCGTTDYTNGWKRIEFIASPGIIEDLTRMQFQWSFQNFTQGNVCIADFTVVELPEEPLVPYAEGEGVVFRGGAGDLDMRIEGTEVTQNEIKVTTTGALYTFDLVNDKISAAQRINKQRVVSEWASSVDLSDLSIKSTTTNECVISNSRITFGVQLDGTLFLTPHDENVVLTCTSKISGIWNRLAYGFLLAMDDYGGFSVTPDIPAGTGEKCKYEVLTEGLDFADYKFMNYRNNTTDEQLFYNSAVSNAKPDWQIAYTVYPGERLAIGTFPPREYDWEDSFDRTYTNATRTQKATQYANYKKNYNVAAVNLFNFSDYGYAQEFNPHYTQVMFKDAFQTHVSAVKAAGLEALMYTSGGYYYTTDPEKYVQEVARLKNKYNLDGIYSDGQPSVTVWVDAYEQSRMLRELFPDGMIVIHTTDAAPIASAAIFMPTANTYATATLKGEGISGIGLDWSMPRSGVWSQYNAANCIGIPKGDKWQYYDENGDLVTVPQGDLDLMLLEYNNRARLVSRTDWTTYMDVLKELRKVWVEHGDDPDFYDKYYAPMARALTKDALSTKYGDIKILDEAFDNESVLSKYGVYGSTTEISADNENNVLKATGATQSANGEILKRIISVAGPLSIEYKFKAETVGDFKQAFSDNYGNQLLELHFNADGTISIDNGGQRTIIGTYQREEWYSVKINADTDTHLCDIYINDERKAQDVSISDKLYKVSDLKFYDAGPNSVYYIDDLKFVDKY
ncbi:MAG: hypothetical protein II997_02030 [Clostridia bacterium]|nr:hypothetical protein [Clostridia bacterium]